MAVHGLVAVAEAEGTATVVTRPAVFAVVKVVCAAARQHALAFFEFGGGAVFAAHVGVVDLEFGAAVAVVRPEDVIPGGQFGDAGEEGGLAGAGGEEQGGEGREFVHGVSLFIV